MDTSGHLSMGHLESRDSRMSHVPDGPPNIKVFKCVRQYYFSHSSGIMHEYQVFLWHPSTRQSRPTFDKQAPDLMWSVVMEAKRGVFDSWGNWGTGTSSLPKSIHAYHLVRAQLVLLTPCSYPSLYDTTLNQKPQRSTTRVLWLKEIKCNRI